MKEKIYVPEDSDGRVVISYTEPFRLDRKAKITVPHQYIALLFADGKRILREGPCDRKTICTMCKEQLGHELQIAFVRAEAIPEALWGFGNVQVNNQNLREVYRAGANGVCKIGISDISDYGRLTEAFPHGRPVTIDTIREKLNAIIASVGVRILGSCLTNSTVSACEVSSLLGEVQDKMQAMLSDNARIREMGLRISALTVAGIHVNREDLESIRSRLIKDKEEPEKEAVPAADGNAPTSGDATAHAPAAHRTQDDAGVDWVMKAAAIQSNVEENLITKFQLPHEKTRFVIDYAEYLKLAEAMLPNEVRFPRGIDKLHVLSSDRDGNPLKIEMTPLVRFVKAGLPAGEAKKAAQIWRVLNCIRHKSPENVGYLRNYFDTPGMTMENFMSDALDCYRKYGLYTKD